MSGKRAYIILSVITSKIYAPHVVPLSCQSIQGRDYHHKEEKCWPVINKASIPVFCLHVVVVVVVVGRDKDGWGEMDWNWICNKKGTYEIYLIFVFMGRNRSLLLLLIFAFIPYFTFLFVNGNQ